MKKYDTIDPTLHYCSCGLSWKPKLHHKILMLIFEDYSRRCPQCGARMTFKYVGHVVKVNTETIRNKGEVYKNG